jgi:hypothetical protein
MRKFVLITGLCFIAACDTGVIVLQILAITGAIRFEGDLPTWGDVAEQVVVGALFAAAWIGFYKFMNRKPRSAGD